VTALVLSVCVAAVVVAIAAADYLTEGSADNPGGDK
jgi:hypothetical protein